MWRLRTAYLPGGSGLGVFIVVPGNLKGLSPRRAWNLSGLTVNRARVPLSLAAQST